MSRKKIILLFINICLPLVIGSMIYILNIFHFIIPSLIRNFIPDFLWFYSFSFSIFTLRQVALIDKLTFALYILSPIFFELLQAFDFVKGTFDLFDIIAYYLGGVISFISFRKFYCTEQLIK